VDLDQYVILMHHRIWHVANPYARRLHKLSMMNAFMV